jgi:hypothetical protein
LIEEGQEQARVSQPARGRRCGSRNRCNGGRVVRLAEVLEELPPEQPGEHANRQQEADAGRDPTHDIA